MKPLNRPERSHTFLRFFLLFLVTIALVIIVVFFSVEVPVKESKQLRDKVLAMEKEKALSDSLTIVMRQAVDELNQFDPTKGLAIATSSQVEVRIERMYKILEKIPNGKNSIYELVIQNMAQLNEAKKQLNSRK